MKFVVCEIKWYKSTRRVAQMVPIAESGEIQIAIKNTPRSLKFDNTKHTMSLKYFVCPSMTVYMYLYVINTFVYFRLLYVWRIRDLLLLF